MTKKGDMNEPRFWKRWGFFEIFKMYQVGKKTSTLPQQIYKNKIYLFYSIFGLICSPKAKFGALKFTFESLH